jgi:hypothetical protein
LNAADVSIPLIVAVGALFLSSAMIAWKWDSYSLPIRLVPLDLLTIVLLIDLNIKSLSNITVDDIVMKLEAIAFTALLVFVLFAPVLWRVSQGRKSKTR